MTAAAPASGEGHTTEIVIAAPPQRVYDLLTDITRMGEWSPECVGCRWIGARRRLEVGARFRGTSRNGWRRWSTVSTVVTDAPGRTFEFEVTYFRLRVATWRYDFRPTDDGGTHLAESFEDHRGNFLRAVSPVITGSSDRALRNAERMWTTLSRLKAAAEQRL